MELSVFTGINDSKMHRDTLGTGSGTFEGTKIPHTTRPTNTVVLVDEQIITRATPNTVTFSLNVVFF